MEFSYLHNWFKETREKCWNKYKKFEGLNNSKCLEIGCFEGQSSIWIIENLVKPNGHFFAIDVFSREKVFDHNIQVSEFGHLITKLKGDGVIKMASLMEEHEETFDFIYIDASKLACDNTFAILIAERLLKVGGVVIVDDYNWGEGKELIFRPYHGIETFKKLTVLCEEIDPPCDGQASFVKVISNNRLVSIEKSTWE